MKQLKIIFILAVASMGGKEAIGQHQLNLALNYNAAVPLSSGFRDYVSKTSFRGFQGSVLYSVNNSLRVGLQSSYNDFYQKYPRQVYKTTDGSDISTVISNTMQVVPVLLKGEYSLLKNGWVKPYVGLGAGIGLINYSQFLGEFEFSHAYTKAAFTGDFGVLMAFKKTGEYGLRLSTSYNLSPFNEAEIKNVDSWNVQVGVVIPLNK
jgi:opacity protein-like surface antigen